MSRLSHIYSQASRALRRKLSGTYIIEASFIYPIIFFIVFAVFCMSAYVHDCITLNADMYSCVIESSMYGEDGNLARVRFANRNNGVLFLSKHIDDGSSCSKEKLTLSTKMKFLNMSQYTTMVTDKDMEVEYMNYRPQDLVRAVHVGKGLFKNEKTGDSKNDISKRIIK